MANRNSWKEYADLMATEGAPQPPKAATPKTAKSLGKDLTKAVQGAISGMMERKENPREAKMQLNPKENSLKGWGRNLR